MKLITETLRRHKLIKGLSVFALLVVCISLILVVYIRLQFNPPEGFTQTIAFEIAPGMSVRDISKAAASQGVVRSELLLYSILTYSYDPTNIYAGTYIFTEPTSVFGVAKKLADKDIEKNLVRVTIPEGIRLTQIAEIANTALPDFDEYTYLLNTSELEGYLFPETYFVPESFTAADFITLQQKTYEEALTPLREDIKASTLTEYETLILASIVEREANDTKSMKMVAGILLNRLHINMALQADASIEYILDKPLSELTSEDLKIDSPYNTYLNPGLVPTPIGNPGIMAIEAVVYPTPSDNFFYITAPDGTFHYAETFAEHNRNIQLYLR